MPSSMLEMVPVLVLGGVTEDGLRKLRYAWILEEPFRVFHIRPDLPLGDRTVWKTMVILQKLRWEWRQMPKNRAGLAHSPASPLIWYTRGNAAHSWYLQALLFSQELFAAGLDCIPHGKYHSAYKTLLSGGRLAATAAACSCAGGHRGGCGICGGASYR